MAASKLLPKQLHVLWAGLGSLRLSGRQGGRVCCRLRWGALRMWGGPGLDADCVGDARG